MPAAASTEAYNEYLLRPLGRFPEAITALRKASELDPLNARVWSVLGSMLVVHRVAGPDAHAAGLRVRRGRRILPPCGHSAGCPISARHHRALDRELAGLLRRLGPEDRLEADRIYRRLRADDPSDAATHWNHALLLKQSGRFQEALAALDAYRSAPRHGRKRSGCNCALRAGFSDGRFRRATRVRLR